MDKFKEAVFLLLVVEQGEERAVCLSAAAMDEAEILMELAEYTVHLERRGSGMLCVLSLEGE